MPADIAVRRAAQRLYERRGYLREPGALAWCAGIGVVSIALSAIIFRRRTAS